MILLIGGTGYIGQKFQESLTERNLEFVNLSRKNFNYYDFKALDELIAWNLPKFVINAAGFTGKPNVDQCEIEKSETILGNVLLPQIISQVCDLHDIPLIHVSSGCIYSGDKGEDANGSKIGFTEEDTPNFSYDSPIKSIKVNSPLGERTKQFNCSFYSGSKALAETVVSKFERSYICRLRIPFDEFDSSRNYLSKIQRYNRVYDAVNSISHRGEFVEACIDLALNESPYGIYNITNGGYITTRQVVELARKKLKLKKKFDYWKNDAAFYGEIAVAPRSNCVMDNSKLLEAGVQMRHCLDAIGESLDKWVKE